mmetsp:Transcript_22934/g.53323  ORF Transcript_22934/g.53323 Transcript_22934/m.53323 type:complete len:217 (-) Transcript_22934:130-780(-)
MRQRHLVLVLWPRPQQPVLLLEPLQLPGSRHHRHGGGGGVHPRGGAVRRGRVVLVKRSLHAGPVRHPSLLLRSNRLSGSHGDVRWRLEQRSRMQRPRGVPGGCLQHILPSPPQGKGGHLARSHSVLELPRVGDDGPGEPYCGPHGLDQAKLLLEMHRTVVYMRQGLQLRGPDQGRLDSLITRARCTHHDTVEAARSYGNQGALLLHPLVINVDVAL